MAELLFLSQQEVLDNVMCHPVVQRRMVRAMELGVGVKPEVTVATTK